MVMILRRKRKKKRRVFLWLFFLGIIMSMKLLNDSKIKITDKEFIDFLIQNTFTEKDPIITKVVKKVEERTNPIKVLKNNYQSFVSNSKEQEVIEKTTSPMIYLYNSHPTEEYLSSTYAEFSINPTVMMNDYILEDVFNRNGFSTIVEERSVKDILKENRWKYYESYKASRILLEQSIEQYPTLNYFIDIHRDSLEKEKTTVTIDEKSYAKILFIVGLENEQYLKNLQLTEKIHQKIIEKYPSLSKGILKKGGEGVNGVYNQDFSPNTILVEIGGYQNNTTEVLNSALAFAECFMEVINEETI